MAVSELAKRASSINIADLAHADETERQARYDRAWDAYDGESELPFDDGESGQAIDNIRLGYAELIVDKGVSFLAGKGGVEWQIEPIDGDEDQDGEPDESEDPERDDETKAAKLDRERARVLAVLDEAWPEEDRALDFHNLATNGGVCGHFWLRLHEDRPPVVLDPTSVTAVWSEDDISILVRYLIEWLALDSDTGLGVKRRHRIEPDVPARPTSWTTFYEQYDEDAGWQEIDEPQPWGHSYAPVIGGQNLPSPNTFYGKPDLTPAVLDMVEQMESLASDMRRICRLHGHPIPVVMGVDADKVQEIDVAIGELLALPDVNAKLGQLTIAELESSLSLYKELKTALFEETHIPRVALGDRDKSGATTGVALQIEYGPLVERTDTKRLTYGAKLRKTAECLLDMRGIKGWRVRFGWPQIVPSDDKAAAETTETDLRMGVVSLETAAEKRGYDWAVESERIAEEKRQAQARFDEGLTDDTDPPPPDVPDPDEE